MQTSRHTLQIDSRQTTSMFIYTPSSSPAATLVLGHGAGAPQGSPFMVAVAKGLADRGLEVATFNFLYMEQKRRVPDPPPMLEHCFRAAIEAVRNRAARDEPPHFSELGEPHARSRPRPLIIGGKSMGGRIATHVAAAGDDTAPAVDGIVLLGYPLHPPGKPQQLRAAHLPQVRGPMLFIQGSRDSFGTAEELAPILQPIPGTTLFVVDGGDHSLNVKRKGGPSREQVYAMVEDEIVRWVTEELIH